MKVEIVVYGPENRRHVLGEAEIYSHSWRPIPREIQLDLDLGILSNQFELVLHRKEELDALRNSDNEQDSGAELSD